MAMAIMVPGMLSDLNGNWPDSIFVEHDAERPDIGAVIDDLG